MICINIINSWILNDFLWKNSCDTTSSSWSWNHSHCYWSALSFDFCRNCMDITNSWAPISSSYWNNVELCINKCSFDSNLNFFCNFDSNTNMPSSISHGDDSLESGSLSSFSLLLDWSYAHNFINKCRTNINQKFINNLSFFNWYWMCIDFF